MAFLGEQEPLGQQSGDRREKQTQELESQCQPRANTKEREHLLCVILLSASNWPNGSVASNRSCPAMAMESGGTIAGSSDRDSVQEKIPDAHSLRAPEHTGRRVHGGQIRRGHVKAETSQEAEPCCNCLGCRIQTSLVMQDQAETKVQGGGSIARIECEPYRLEGRAWCETWSDGGLTTFEEAPPSECAVIRVFTRLALRCCKRFKTFFVCMTIRFGCRSRNSIQK
jgi:hypothetical protein